MESIPKMALKAARKRGLDLSVELQKIPTSPFRFRCLKPKHSTLEVFQKAREAGEEWVPGMPLAIVTYHTKRKEYEIMDGMMRICAAIMAGYDFIPAIVAKGETHDALYDILLEGYYGQDFVEMLAMANPSVDDNLRMGDAMRLAGK